ncbi:GNAT family N-acetyltransferase [Neptunicella marina]|uniref:GNAT family N-acetyltransferase n=1 Tax=Neptunicella marina TaxID=2125989 RepID=A0A8J6M6D6_9ALTE|nr:GNAT family N-acetyltransferase [Neptunicella marina]MBC3767076.1 GNAT family N-acetyltransferase [Neptunicella marina]
MQLTTEQPEFGPDTAELRIEKIDWQQTLDLRHRILWPDKDAEFCQVEGDEQALHFGGFIHQQLVSVASIFIHGRSARLRKFATDGEFQGLGIGSAMLGHVIAFLKDKDVDFFWCDARTSALAFYMKLGMKPDGERFDKSGIEYVKMRMPLKRRKLLL